MWPLPLASELAFAEELNPGIKQKYLISRFEFLRLDPLVVPCFCSVLVNLGTVVSLFSPLFQLCQLDLSILSGLLQIHVPLPDGPVDSVF